MHCSCGEVVAKLWGPDILSGRDKVPSSHGNQAFEKFAKGGARMEAASGFSTVYKIGLPVLNKLLQSGHDRDTSLIGTLMTLMEFLPDTNLLWRGGEEGLAFVNRSAASFNLNGGVEAPYWQSSLLAMHHEFVAHNLSPGGSADLVAATWAVHQIETIIKQSN
jgi:triphosphoribosyl-dephospho-CoA synthase